MAHGPWVDLHAHPGRCFLAGLDAGDALTEVLGSDTCDASVAEIARAGMAAVSFATVADLRVLGFKDDGGLHAVRPFYDGEAYADHRRQLSGLDDLARSHHLSIVRRADDIVAAHGAGDTSLLVTCEGADFVEGDLGRLEECHAAGVRSVTLVHYRQNEYGDLQTEPPLHGGLSPVGRELVREMNRIGLLIDLAHASYETTLGVLEESSRPVMISHTHLNGDGRDNARLVSVEHARAVASAGGLVGAWPAGVSSQTFEDFIDEIIRLVDAIGTDHVGIGTDMDANYRPVMVDFGQFGSIQERLLARGLTLTEADQVLGKNAVELVRRACG
ncbi:MAG: dipeptidase [Acidimicrobiales bacterium]